MATELTTLERMVRAVERVRERLLRAAGALEAAGVPYAVVGGNAVAAWVARHDPAAVRNTQDVDILLRREDLDDAREALEGVGFVFRHVRGIDMFLDGPGAKARDAVHVLFADEKVREDDPFPVARIDETERFDEFTGVSLEALVRMTLTRHQRVDRVHVRDMIDVGLVDQTWVDILPAPLDERLQALLDDPDG